MPEDRPKTRLWGGRFRGSTDELVEHLNNSFAFDRRLWREDIAGSVAHATMLGATGIIGADESAAIVAGLREIEAGVADGSLEFDSASEDIHTAVEALLTQRIGPVAGKLHTARSRNDQVATDLRLYAISAVDAISAELRALQDAILTIAERERSTVLPGYTHLQHAQPVLLAHHVLAHFWMFERDLDRLRDARKRCNSLPLGAGALAGTTFAIDRNMVARDLGFASVCENSLDAVSDRDFVIDVLSAAALIMVHCSRIGEEMVLWSCPEFGFVNLDDSVTTGSSIMPQKKNPDVAELVRGKTGRAIGHLVTLLTVLKGLPLSYNKDLQEDKEPLFDTVDTLLSVLPALALMLRTASFRRERMAASTRGDFSTATDLADALVRTGMPFRRAHEVVGNIVRECVEQGIALEDLDPADLEHMAPELGSEGAKWLSVQGSIEARTAQGGTAPSAVDTQLAQARDAFARKY